MKYLIGLALVGLAVMLVVTGPPGRAAETAPPGRVVRLGLVSTLFRDVPEEMAMLVMAPLRSMIEADTGMSGQLVKGGDPLALARKLDDNDLQLGVFHGIEFAWAREKHPDLKPVAVAMQTKTYPQAVIVVRRDSSAQTLADLRSKTIATPRVRGIHCNLYFERHGVPSGTTTDKFYGKVTSGMSTETALNSVVTRRTDAAVVDTGVLASFQESYPGRAENLRVLVESGPLPPAVLAYIPGRLPDGAVRSLQNTLVNARNTPGGKRLLDMMRLNAFEAPAEDLDKLLTETLKLYPAPTR